MIRKRKLIYRYFLVSQLAMIFVPTKAVDNSSIECVHSLLVFVVLPIVLSRICWFVEFAFDVANFFCTEPDTNRNIWDSKSSPISSIVFEWIDWNRFVRGIVALVIYIQHQQLTICNALHILNLFFIHLSLSVQIGHVFWHRRWLEQLRWHYKFHWPCFAM